MRIAWEICDRARCPHLISFPPERPMCFHQERSRREGGTFYSIDEVPGWCRYQTEMLMADGDDRS
jgi:hypothetical protein